MDQIRHYFAYDTWANQRTLESVQTVAAPSEKLLGLLAHIFSSKRMWLGRIKQTDDATISTWPTLSYEESSDLGERMRAAWSNYLDSLTETDLKTEIHYTIKDVGPGMQTVADIITHKFLHAAYHRGQIAMLVREQGGTPASTDLVVWAKAMRG